MTARGEGKLPGALTDLAIRRSTAADAPALERLAQLDGAAQPEDDHLLALEDGALRAALPLDGRSAIADPFHPTAHLVQILELRAGRLEPTVPGRRGLRVPVRRRRRASAGARSRAGLLPRPGH